MDTDERRWDDGEELNRERHELREFMADKKHRTLAEIEAEEEDGEEALRENVRCGTKKYWMITVAYSTAVLANERTTVGINCHPADWLANHGNLAGEARRDIVFAMPVSKEQYQNLKKAGYG